MTPRSLLRLRQRFAKRQEDRRALVASALGGNLVQRWPGEKSGARKPLASVWRCPKLAQHSGEGKCGEKHAHGAFKAPKTPARSAVQTLRIRDLQTIWILYGTVTY
eukprot:scaffold1313_cov250-Pinguiococcus_pyrenoidosus.AAC.5